MKKRQVLFLIFILLSVFVGCTKKEEQKPTPDQSLKNQHENLVMKTNIARKIYDLVSNSDETKICGLNKNDWSEKIKNMTEERKNLPKLPTEQMDQIDRSLNHFYCDQTCIQNFCKEEL